MFSDLLIRLRALFRRDTVESELDEELRFHVDHQIEKLVRAGMPLAEATRRARLIVGTPDKIKEECRDARGTRFLEDIWHDVRYAVRILHKSPGFAAVAVLTLALGIGANSAIFSVVNSVLLRQLPYRDAKHLVWVDDYLPTQKISAVFDADYFAWRKHCVSFDEMTMYSNGQFALTGAGDAERMNGVVATWTYLRTLGVAPQIGRDISADEDRPNVSRVVLLSDSLWRRRFSTDPGVLGHTITLDGNLYTIIGVLPQGFEFPDNRKGEVLAPMAMEEFDAATKQTITFVSIIARLKAGVTPQAAAAELDTVGHSFRAASASGFAKAFANSHADVITLQERLVGNVRRALLLLLGAVSFVLLIACANVANLQLARAAGREKEFAVRVVLGAGRWRLARQLLTESTLMGLAGGVAGLALGAWLVALARHYGPRNIPHLDVTSLDGRVVLFTIAISFLTGILSGLAPIISSAGLSLNESLAQSGAQGSAGRKVVRPQQVLIALELAMALVLLIGAGLLARSFSRLVSIPTGFNSHDVIAAGISLPAKAYLNGDQERAFYSQLMERVQALPGVLSAGGVAALPFDGSVRFVGGVQVEGRSASGTGAGGAAWLANPNDVPANNLHIAQNAVLPGYFSTLRIPLRAGRYLDRRDRVDSPQTTVVNDTFVKYFLPNENPIGRRIQFGRAIGTNVWCTIVGVVGDTKQIGSAAETMPEAFLPFDQLAFPNMALVIRTDAGAGTILAGVRAALASVDKNVPLSTVETLDDMLAGRVASQRFNMALLVAFAGLALMLAAVGIYGVMAYAVGQRRQEIGIRMALGALPRNVQRMVLAQGARLAAFGVVIGLGAGYWLTRLLGSVLFEVKPSDPATFVGGAIVLFGVALVACWLPARRAMRVDPIVALRYE
jgi:putative ABC transport system permease protein